MHYNSESEIRIPKFFLSRPSSNGLFLRVSPANALASPKSKASLYFLSSLLTEKPSPHWIRVKNPRYGQLEGKSYRPDGNTALNDAIGITVRKVEHDNSAVNKIVTVIMTDGEENSSREWSLDGVRALIEQTEKEGRWTFIFMGAGLDAWAQGQAYGVKQGNVAQYQTDRYKEVFAAMAKVRTC